MMKYPIKIYNDEYNDTIKINVSIIDKCNYQCAYCINLKHNYVRTNKQLDLYKFFDFIKWLHNKTNKKIWLQLLGGEPSIHTEFLNFCKLCNNFDWIDIRAFTNFSHTYEFYQETIKYKVKWLLSYHYLNNNRTNIFKEKLDKIFKINSNYDYIDTINIMLSPNSFDKCLEVFDNLYSKYGHIVRCNLIDDFDKDQLICVRSKNYTQDEIKQYEDRCKNCKIDKYITITYNDNTTELVDDYSIKNSSQYNFKHWKCAAGKLYFNVTIDENIYSCTSYNSKPIATLDSYKHMKIRDIICPTSCCCELDIPKEKIFK